MSERKKPHIYLKYYKQFQQSKWGFEMAATYVGSERVRGGAIYFYHPSPLQKLLNSEAKKFVERLNQKCHQ